MCVDPPSPALAASPRAEAASLPEELVAVVQELSFARCVADIQHSVRRAARALTRADGASFVLREGEQCYYADEDAIAPLWKGRRFPMSSCISGWAMRHGQAVLIEDVLEDERIPQALYRPTFVRGLAMMPVRARDPIAAIGTYWAAPHRASAAELRVLQALADSTAIAFENLGLIEELRRARDAAESASRLKDEFLLTLSHELRTPLNPILGWATLIADGALDPAGVREAAEEIVSGARLELQHVEQLLEVSRILSGRSRIECVPVSAGEPVDAALHAVRPAAQAKQIVLERVPDEEPIELCADPRRLQQIAWNLLSNAVKFTPAGGTVRVWIERAAGAVRLCVSDTGPGIAPELRPHLFERFRPGDASLRRAVGGLGLGLALVRHLAELHGGRVFAESGADGRGALFTVELPLNPAANGTARQLPR